MHALQVASECVVAKAACDSCISVLRQRFVDSDVGRLVLSGFVKSRFKDFDGRKFCTELSLIRSGVRTSLKKKRII